MEKVPQTSLIIAGGILEKDGKFLLVNANTGAPKGLWNNPAGKTDEGETVEDAAVREVKEETGFDVSVEGLVGVYHRPINKKANINIIRVNFKMKIIGGELDPPEDEITEARWFSIDEVKAMDDSKFAAGTKECIIDFIEHGSKEQNTYSITKDVI